MTDQFDRAQELEQMTRDIALQKHRTFKAISAFYCEDCDIPIPEKRRQFGIESKNLAAKFTESRQVKKLEKLYQKLIAEKADV